MTKADEKRLQEALNATRRAREAMRKAVALANGKAALAAVQAAVDEAIKAKREADAKLKGGKGEKALKPGTHINGATAALMGLTEQFQTLTQTGPYQSVKTSEIAPYKAREGGERRAADRGAATTGSRDQPATRAATRDSAASREDTARRTADQPAPSPKPVNEANVGAFGNMPRATPKYAINKGNRTHYRETIARMYLWLTPGEFSRFAVLAKEASKYDKRIIALANRLGVSAKNPTDGYIEFLLHEAVHNHNEKIEVVESLAHKHSLYVFGAEPPVYNYSAFLLNNKQDDQAANLQRLYWLFLRAGQLAHLRTQVHLQYNEMLVSGVMTNLQLSLQANDESYQRAAFQLIVRSVKMLQSTDTVNTYNPGMVTLDKLPSLPEVLSVSVDWPKTNAVQLAGPPSTMEERGARMSLPREEASGASQLMSRPGGP